MGHARGMYDHLAHPSLPPGPTGFELPLMHRWTTDMRGFLTRAHRDYGDVFTVRIRGQRPLVIFATADAAREIIRDDGAKLGMANDLVQIIVGPESMLMKNGAVHAAHRRRMVPALTGEALMSHTPRMKRVIAEHVERLPVGASVPLLPWVRRLTLSIIQECLFEMQPGPEYEAMAEDVMRHAEQGQTPASLMAALLVPPAVLESLTRGRFDAAGNRLSDPMWMRPLVRHPLLKASRRVRERLLKHAREIRTGQVVVPEGSVLHAMLRLANAQGATLTDSALCDDLLTLLVAGHDTTALSFSWLALLLARHPDVLARIRAELAEAGGFAALGGDALRRLPYLEATVRESMRLMPIVAGMGRTALEPVTIAGMLIPAGVGVAALTFGVQHDATLYDDPLRFDPARQLGTRVRPEHAFPFGGGYRRCVGASFANIELQLLTAAFVERVDFATDQAHGPLGGGASGMLTGPVDGARVNVRSVRRGGAAQPCEATQAAS